MVQMVSTTKKVAILVLVDYPFGEGSAEKDEFLSNDVAILVLVDYPFGETLFFVYDWSGQVAILVLVDYPFGECDCAGCGRL